MFSRENGKQESLSLYRWERLVSSCHLATWDCPLFLWCYRNNPRKSFDSSKIWKLRTRFRLLLSWVPSFWNPEPHSALVWWEPVLEALKGCCEHYTKWSRKAQVTVSAFSRGRVQHGVCYEPVPPAKLFRNTVDGRISLWYPDLWRKTPADDKLEGFPTSSLETKWKGKCPSVCYSK